MKIEFWKIEAAGNDFVLLDMRDMEAIPDIPKVVKKICMRRFGIGADGVIFIFSSKEYDFEMQYYNSDGSGPAMCGNGGRAALFYVNEKNTQNEEITNFLAADGGHKVYLKNQKIGLSIKKPELIKKISEPESWLIDTGVPHLVIPCNNVKLINLKKKSEPLRKKYNANVNFISKHREDRWNIRTFERGVEDETMACGTGATAAAFFINQHLKQKKPLTLIARGGELLVEEKQAVHWLFGPVNKVFEGTVII